MAKFAETKSRVSVQKTIMTVEEFREVLKNMPGDLVLAFDDLEDGRISVRRSRLGRLVKPKRPGLNSGTVLLALSENPRIGAEMIMTVEKLRVILKSLPDELEIAFDNSEGGALENEFPVASVIKVDF